MFFSSSTIGWYMFAVWSSFYPNLMQGNLISSKEYYITRSSMSCVKNYVFFCRQTSWNIFLRWNQFYFKNLLSTFTEPNRRRVHQLKSSPAKRPKEQHQLFPIHCWTYSERIKVRHFSLQSRISTTQGNAVLFSLICCCFQWIFWGA